MADKTGTSGQGLYPTTPTNTRIVAESIPGLKEELYKNTSKKEGVMVKMGDGAWTFMGHLKLGKLSVGNRCVIYRVKSASHDGDCLVACNVPTLNEKTTKLVHDLEAAEGVKVESCGSIMSYHWFGLISWHDEWPEAKLWCENSRIEPQLPEHIKGGMVAILPDDAKTVPGVAEGELTLVKCAGTFPSTAMWVGHNKTRCMASTEVMVPNPALWPAGWGIQKLFLGKAPLLLHPNKFQPTDGPEAAAQRAAFAAGVKAFEPQVVTSAHKGALGVYVPSFVATEEPNSFSGLMDIFFATKKGKAWLEGSSSA